MAYVERGVVKGKRTIWRLSIIPDFFKAIINFIKMFFLTMFSAEKTDSYKRYGGGPRGPRTLSDLPGSQSSLPACGSCCG
ncbi:unnamed protein product [Alopecurus aequalis]